MPTKLDEDAVKNFLKICKKEISNRNCHFVESRMINMNGDIVSAKQALLDIGITNKKQIWKIINDLTIENCIGVSFDYDNKRDTNSEIFELKKEINDIDVYIKLTLRSSGIICISFHRSY